MIRLEKFSESDFDLLISWIHSEEELIQFAGPIFSYPLTHSQLLTYLSDEKRNSFKVIDSKNGSVLGHAEIYYKDVHSAKLCRILIGEKSYRGKGLGTQLINLLVTMIQNNNQIDLIELNVYEHNFSAIRCYEKCGFKINPEVSNEIKVNGNVWKSINMIYKP